MLGLEYPQQVGFKSRQCQMHAAIVFLCLVVFIRKENSCLHPAERDGVCMTAAIAGSLQRS
jgi:hypothetical protein